MTLALYNTLLWMVGYTQYSQGLILLKLSSFLSGMQTFRTLTTKPPNMTAHRWSITVFAIKNAQMYLLIYFKQNDIQSSAKRFQFLLVNDESHWELSSIRQQTSTSTCQPPSKLLRASYQSKIRNLHKIYNTEITEGKPNPLVLWPAAISKE